MVAIRKIHIKKIHHIIPYHKHVFLYSKALLWFGIGAVLGLFFLTSFAYILFRLLFNQVAYPGVTVAGVNVGGKSEVYIEQYFDTQNQKIAASSITFQNNDLYATASAGQLQMGYNSKLLAQQALSIGRSADTFSNFVLMFSSFLTGVPLPPSYTMSDMQLRQSLSSAEKIIHKDPVDAQFSFTNGRVTTVTLSSDGHDIDFTKLDQSLLQRIPILLAFGKTQDIQIQIPIAVITPKITTEKANNLGIKELIGTGESLFQGSIPSRIYNIQLAASRLNGVVVAPNEEFSFDSALGDVSSYTGYKQAYVIQNGHTVLGDGGGVCQVSTTMFRAILNAGLPITERHAHDYRVEYYEEDGPPGIDATVYVPTVDLKFLNTTGHNILIQTIVDPNALRLTFYLYGVKDGRQVTMTTPIVTNVVPAPAPLYQDDPNLPKGITQQTDFAANGATVTFNRIVAQNGKQIINETYVSNYRPWQAVYLVGSGS